MTASNANSKKKIVVADDDPAILDALSWLLEDEGYCVNRTCNEETKQVILEENPDLLLLDIWMSGVDGRDICRELKSKSPTNKIPIIMISASKDAEKSAVNAGADDFIAKPFEIDELLSKIKQYI